MTRNGFVGAVIITLGVILAFILFRALNPLASLINFIINKLETTMVPIIYIIGLIGLSLLFITLNYIFNLGPMKVPIGEIITIARPRRAWRHLWGLLFIQGDTVEFEVTANNNSDIPINLSYTVESTDNSTPAGAERREVKVSHGQNNYRLEPLRLFRAGNSHLVFWVNGNAKGRQAAYVFYTINRATLVALILAFITLIVTLNAR